MKTEEQQWEAYRNKNFPKLFLKNDDYICIVDSNFEITSKIDVTYEDADLSKECKEFIVSNGFSIQEDMDFFDELSEVELHTYVDFAIDVQLGDIKCSGNNSEEYDAFKERMSKRTIDSLN